MAASADCARTLLAQLASQGVTDVVVCPGSRSAPLALAAAEAERRGLVRLHVRVDERSAAFLAVGLGKATRRPAAVITTSGTAVGNLLPAVMEASHSRTPLLLITADRSADLVGFGANQTTDQVGLFGGFVRARLRVSSDAPAAWSAHAAGAVVRALGGLGGEPGPVQVNVELREPLVPDGDEAWPEVVPLVVPDAPAQGGTPMTARPLRTIVIVGDATPEEGERAAEFAAAAGVPLVAEPSSNARRAGALRGGELLLTGPLADRVELAIVVGHPTLSRPVSALLGRTGVEVVAVRRADGWAEPGRRVRAVVDDVGDLALAAPPAGWLEEWQDADAAASRHMDAVLGELEAEGRVSGWAVAAGVLAAASAGVLVVGASQVIRDISVAPIGERPPVVFANRGLAGIDGTISTAVGVALGQRRPTVLVCGDLTFLHDSNGLLLGPGEPVPDLRIVVLDDRGGAIFSTLEYGDARFAADFDRLFGTPTRADIAAVAEASGVRSRRVAGASDLAQALAEPISGIDVLVVDLDRSDRRELNRRLADGVA